MRYSRKGETTNQTEHQLFGVHFHDRIQQEQTPSNVELADEGDVSIRAIQQLKKKMERN